MNALSSSATGIAASQQGSILAEAAARALAITPERQTIEYHGNWLTYGDLAQVANRVRALLIECGADERAPVAFAPRNRPSAIAALMGLVASAATIRMMYVYQSGEALAANFARIKASVLVMDAEDFTPPVIEQLGRSGCVGIAITETGGEFVAGWNRVTFPTDPDAPPEPTFEMLTSGTTGQAKLWPLTYDLLEKRFVSGNSVISEELLTAPPILLCYPLCNVSGLYSAVPAIVAGLRIVLQDRFTLDGWLDYVNRYPMPDLYLPPIGVQGLLDADVPREALGPAPRFVRCGMTKLPVETQRAFEDKYGIPIVQSYGATEFGGVVIQMEYEHALEFGQTKLGSTGRAYGEAKVRIVDPDSGEVLGPREQGLLEVMVPSIGPDFVRTSDIAMIDEDEFVYILGRADSAIMRGGFKILPETVENALILHPDIEAAAVLGVADRRLGQVPAALIEMKPSRAPLSDAELEAHVRRHVPSTHVPAYWRFTEKMPRTASLKVSLGDVRATFADLAG